MFAVTSGKAGINLYLGLAFVLNIPRPTSTVFALAYRPNCCSVNAPYSISVLNKKRGIINLKIWYWIPHPMWTPRVNNTPDCKPCWPIECSINVTSLVTIFLFQSRT
ncbi:Uncharacterised protein [Vibrio cholerae]|nr:Uncharacterised protein [Vibrio cholerae]